VRSTGALAAALEVHFTRAVLAHDPETGMTPTTFYIKQGNTRPFLVAQLVDDAGAPVDLTGSTVVFRMLNAAGTRVVNAAAVVDNALAGQVHYAWQSGDTATLGNYRGEFEITFPDATVQSIPTGPNGPFIPIAIQLAA
jgi:hypothetical protein